MNGECRCQSGAYYVEGESRCAPCHADCDACSGPNSNKCSICKDDNKKLQKTQGSTVGSCVPLNDSSGQVKPEFKDDVETLGVDTKKAPGIVPPTPQNFKVAKRPVRLPPSGYKRKVPIRLSTKMSVRIQKMGKCFKTIEFIKVEIFGLVSGTGFTHSGSLAADKTSLDMNFKILDKRRLFVIIKFTIIRVTFFFQNIRKVGQTCVRRALQEFVRRIRN